MFLFPAPLMALLLDCTVAIQVALAAKAGVRSVLGNLIHPKNSFTVKLRMGKLNRRACRNISYLQSSVTMSMSMMVFCLAGSVILHIIFLPLPLTLTVYQIP